MPTCRAALEQLKYEVSQGRGEESVHIVFVAKEQRKRIANNQRKTRFVLNCDDPDLCSRLEAAKDRIFRKVRNKAIMLTLMEKAWEEALADSELDKILSVMEGPNG